MTYADITRILPQPFAWCTVPAGSVKLSTNEIFNVATFSLAKYPVTNAQFAKFIEANGYTTPAWWTAEGWRRRKEENWTEPAYWTDSRWNGADQPVGGISWLEAMAFCGWLSSATGEKINLPTEQQWQRAAQGNDGRDYPWGNDWNGNNCNNSVDKDWQEARTSGVTHYEGKGSSPFGVVDMSGNVWEWSLTPKICTQSEVNMRMLRGGSCQDVGDNYFRTVYRDSAIAAGRDVSIGFRIARG